MSTHSRATVTVAPHEIRLGETSIALREGLSARSDGDIGGRLFERLCAMSDELLEVRVDPEIPFCTLADVLYAAARAGQGRRGLWLRDVSDLRAHPISLPPFILPEGEVAPSLPARSAARAAYATARLLITVTERGIAWDLADAHTGPATIPYESDGGHLEWLAEQLTDLKAEQPTWNRAWLTALPEVPCRAVVQVIAVARGDETSPRFGEVVVSAPRLVSFTGSS